MSAPATDSVAVPIMRVLAAYEQMDYKLNYIDVQCADGSVKRVPNPLMHNTILDLQADLFLGSRRGAAKIALCSREKSQLLAWQRSALKALGEQRKAEGVDTSTIDAASARLEEYTSCNKTRRTSRAASVDVDADVSAPAAQIAPQQTLAPAQTQASVTTL